MSKFEDNPFGDPTIDNPFADPSVQQVANSTNNAQRGLDDYNPFEAQENRNNQTSQQQSTQPAIMQAVPPPATQTYNSTQQPQSSQPPPNFTTADFQRRQEELERKAEELARREAELRAGGGAAGRHNNWPPLPAACPFQPCFYQDINVDIPLEFQRIVRHLYYLWMFHTLVMAANVIGGMALLFHSNAFTTFGLSILYFMLFTPFSFVCWYRPIYKAFRSDSSFNFMVFFFIFFFQFIVTTIQAIGLPGGGSCGMILAISTFDGTSGGVVVGVLTLLIALGFVTAATADILLIAKVHRIYRSTGASMAKAQAEFTTEFLRNQHVQTAASSAAAAAVNAQINANRY